VGRAGSTEGFSRLRERACRIMVQFRTARINMSFEASLAPLLEAQGGWRSLPPLQICATGLGKLQITTADLCGSGLLALAFGELTLSPLHRSIAGTGR